MVRKEIGIFNLVVGALFVAVSVSSNQPLNLGNLSTSPSFIFTVGIAMMGLGFILLLIREVKVSYVQG